MIAKRKRTLLFTLVFLLSSGLLIHLYLIQSSTENIVTKDVTDPSQSVEMPTILSYPTSRLQLSLLSSSRRSPQPPAPGELSPTGYPVNTTNYSYKPVGITTAKPLQFSSGRPTQPNKRKPRPDSCRHPDAIKTWKGSGLVTSWSPPIEASCQKLIAGDKYESAKVEEDLRTWKNSISDSMFIQNISMCSYIRDLLSPNNFYNSDTEKKFPLAYAILFYNSPQQIVRLLKVIYRPQNIYCLHPDGKTNGEFIQVFRQLASCFDNIFVPMELVKVTYMHFSMVEAQMWCFKQLATRYRHWQWKYATILCGKELPFSTNREIVNNLRRLNGASVIDIRKLPVSHYNNRFKEFYLHDPNSGRLYNVGQRKDKMPRGVKIYKSLNYFSASRKFVEFLLKNKRVQVIRRYMSTALMPDEEFFATAYMLSDAPKGDGTGVLSGKGAGRHGVRAAKTFFSVDVTPYKCTGKIIHVVCILNIKDLPMLFNIANRATTYFFFNKYIPDYDHVIMDCMEKRIVQQNILEYKRDCLD